MFDFEEKWPFEIPIVVLDTETTGLYPGLGHRVVEIGAIRLEGWKVVREIDYLLQPGRKMEVKASAVSGIRDDDLMGQPTFGDIADELLELLQGALLVAHNASFDAEFLATEFLISGHVAQTERTATVLPNPWLCTLQLARRHFYFGYNNLAHVAQKLGVRIGQIHRALTDVYTTAEVLKRMVHELGKQRIYTVGDLLYAQGASIYAPSPPKIPLPPPIAEAIAKSRQLRIIYISDSGETQRIISPHYAAQHRGEAYLIAYCHLRQEQRTFRLDRIFSAEVVPNT